MTLTFRGKVNLRVDFFVNFIKSTFYNLINYYLIVLFRPLSLF